MNDYEILLMLDPDAPEERHEEILARTRELVEKGGGAFEDHQAWGRRRLAYEIDHRSEGVYHLLTFKSEPDTLSEVSRVLKITDGVLRHMATRRPRQHRRQAAPPSAESAPTEATPAEYAEAPAGGSEGAEVSVDEGEE